MSKLKIEYMSTDELKPYERNAKIHTDEQIEQIKKSIQEFGMNDPIAIWKNNEIIEGHGRLIACSELGIDQVPVIRLDELTNEQRRAYMLVHNQLTMNTDFDVDLLNVELDDITDIDMSDFGFDFDVADDPVDVIEDEAPEPPEEPKSKYGEVYQLGRHRLMCGDSTKLEDVKKLMADDMADMVFTDPPWNVNYGAVEKDNAQGYKPRTIINDFMGTEEFKEFMFSAFKCMNEASKAGACTYVVMSAQEWGNLMLTLAQNDYHWSSTIIWNKDRLVLSRKDYHTKYEPIWYGWKAGARLCPLKDRKQSDVWDFDRPTKSEEHPTMKPVGLVARAVQNSSKKDNLVLDLFGGSGTTLIACEQTDRSCCMMELDPKYVDVIIERWENFTGEKAVLVQEADNENKNEA